MLNARFKTIPLVDLVQYQLLITCYSSVPTVKDVQVPETLLKKNKADAKAAEAAATKKAELKKASILISSFVYVCIIGLQCDDIRDQTQTTSDMSDAVKR